MSMLRPLSALLVLVLLALPTTAFAQDDDGGQIIIIFPGLITTTAAAATIAVAAISPGISSSTSSSSSSSSGGGGCHAEHYIRHNGPALERGLALGGGEAVLDLAELFAVPAGQRKAFARQLRRHRHQLLPLLDLDELTPKRAQRFLDTVAQAIMADNTLSSAWLQAVPRA